MSARALRRALAPFALAALAISSVPAIAPTAHAGLLSSSVHDADEAITKMEVDSAKAILAPLDASDPHVGYELGRLGMETGDCDEAVLRLSDKQVQLDFADAGPMLNVARGCMRAMAATITVVDAEHDVVVRLQDDADRALVPLIGETVAAQRKILARDLGVSMPLPTRIDVVRDQFSLAAMSGLPHEAAQTTGTVAIAKFGRVILLSPRAPELGYGWRDTIAHELTHLALTRGTLDRAPLWLQEGVAKREETRWRAPSPVDEAMPADAVAAAGLEKGLGRPLDDIGPSVALLPSAQQAMVVYAEVTSFVRFISGDRAGVPGAPTDPATLSKIVLAFAKGDDTDGALKEVTGKDLKQWNTVWRPWVATRGGKLPPSLGLDGSMPSDTRELGRTLRVGELLIGRGHYKAARTKLDPIVRPSLLGDPLLGSRVALGRFLAGDLLAAKALVEDPSKLFGNVGSWWSVRGDILRGLSAPMPEILASYETAVAHDPLSEAAACGWADSVPGSDPVAATAKSLCAAARARSAPKLGQD